MALTLRQTFGTGVTIDFQFGNLVINLNDLQDKDPQGVGDFTNGLGLDLSELTPDNQDQYGSRILWALIQLSKQNQPTNNTDNTVGTYITGSGKRNITRNGVAQIGYQELVTGYKNDTSGLNLDPDEIA